MLNANRFPTISALAVVCLLALLGIVSKTVIKSVDAFSAVRIAPGVLPRERLRLWGGQELALLRSLECSRESVKICALEVGGWRSLYTMTRNHKKFLVKLCILFSEQWLGHPNCSGGSETHLKLEDLWYCQELRSSRFQDLLVLPSSALWHSQTLNFLPTTFFTMLALPLQAIFEARLQPSRQPVSYELQSHTVKPIQKVFLTSKAVFRTVGYPFLLESDGLRFRVVLEVCKRRIDPVIEYDRVHGPLIVKELPYLRARGHLALLPVSQISSGQGGGRVYDF
ncbi:hypothetical protein C8J56DRAFT_1033549 [Mycena floridula]|nr:hypothetical protein C8J56DRAFT_1033549 [Mycena floridula]